MPETERPIGKTEETLPIVEVGINDEDSEEETTVVQILPIEDGESTDEGGAQVVESTSSEQE